jgi:hypothetical protein
MSKWPTTRLGEVLQRVKRFEPRDELTEYPFAGTYSFARGIFVGERKLGSTFALPKIQRIRAGDFIYCKIMAWEGAYGIAPKEADNCVMSGAFVVYELNRDKIDEKFLEYFFKVPDHWQSIGSQSTGTNVRRQSLHPSQFERAEIPLPGLAEQRRVVARIEELAAPIHEARTLLHQAAQEAEALLRSIITHDKQAKPTPMRELVKLRSPDVTVRPDETLPPARRAEAAFICVGATRDTSKGVLEELGPTLSAFLVEACPDLEIPLVLLPDGDRDAWKRILNLRNRMAHEGPGFFDSVHFHSGRAWRDYDVHEPLDEQAKEVWKLGRQLCRSPFILTCIALQGAEESMALAEFRAAERTEFSRAELSQKGIEAINAFHSRYRAEAESNNTDKTFQRRIVMFYG